MRIIPAIDVINGECVRLSQGDYKAKTVYSSSPLDVAKSFEDAGLKYLHLVDLDGAKAKQIINADILEQICSQTNLRVDFGGGIKSNKDIERAFSCGAQQITAGSIAVTNPQLVEDWLMKYGAEKIVLGADVKGQQIAINGWKVNTERGIYDFVHEYAKKGIKYLISTDIATDGMLIGPSIELYKTLIDKFKELNIIASGGVSSMNDLDTLKNSGVEGVVIGKAIYENKISTKQLRDYVD
jgi:phosphoribosylformimino-5-aminoimidazole carboxamide ribotide isomerase